MRAMQSMEWWTHVAVEAAVAGDLLVGPVVFLFPIRESALDALAPGRDDESGARVAAVRDRENLADLRPWLRNAPRSCSRCGPGERPADPGCRLR